nr:MAG TPA: endonuclease-like protein [Caudoviricetes sp.]
MMSDKVKKKYYHNGIVNKMFEEGKQPDGFVLGMLPRTKEKQDAINKKRAETTLKKYGVSHVSLINEVKEKKKKALLERYGVDNPSKSKEIQAKKRDIFIKKYGVDSPMKSDIIKLRFKDNYNKKYGVDNPFQLDVVKDKIKDTNRKNLGVDYPTQCQEVRDKVRNTFMERYGVPYYFMLTREWLDANDSKPNRDFAELLDINHIKYEREFRCGKYSYDFKVDNTLIEINPTATHSTSFSPYGDRYVKDKYYHRDKSSMAKDSGYHVVHVFDWDDKGKIINLLKHRDTVYARNCEVRFVDTLECNQYLMAYHLQGKCNNQTIRLGLYYKNQLVSLMTFGVARYNKKYEYELLRYCASHNVIGGAEKLFKYFISEYKPSNIISYCDTSKFNGKVYDALGFKLDTINSPSCHWYSVKEAKHITDNLLRMQGYDRLFKENHGKGTSNEELILARGYLPVYDCGQSTYIWENNKNVE